MSRIKSTFKFTQCRSKHEQNNNYSYNGKVCYIVRVYTRMKRVSKNIVQFKTWRRTQEGSEQRKRENTKRECSRNWFSSTSGEHWRTLPWAPPCG